MGALRENFWGWKEPRTPLSRCWEGTVRGQRCPRGGGTLRAKPPARGGDKGHAAVSATGVGTRCDPFVGAAHKYCHLPRCGPWGQFGTPGVSLGTVWDPRGAAEGAFPLSRHGEMSPKCRQCPQGLAWRVAQVVVGGDTWGQRPPAGWGHGDSDGTVLAPSSLRWLCCHCPVTLSVGAGTAAVTPEVALRGGGEGSGMSPLSPRVPRVPHARGA